MRTPLCDRLGIGVPILQAAVGRCTTPELAAAVTEAGGLGSIALTGYGHRGTLEAIAEIRARTAGPFVANLLLSYDVEEEWRALEEARPPVVSLFWGEAAPHVGRIHAMGALAMATVGSVAEARRAAEAGVDIVVAQGWEAGGHVRGTMSTLALVPAVVDAIAPVPVVAAGGIVDGRGLAAVLCLGAQGAWIGTRFLAAAEADLHPHYRGRVLAAEGADTYWSELYDVGWPDAPGRVLRNSTVEAWEAAGRPAPGARPGEGDTVARTGTGDAILRYQPHSARRDLTGDIEAVPLWAGQGVGLVSREQPAAEIVAELAAGAAAALERTSVRAAG